MERLTTWVWAAGHPLGYGKAQGPQGRGDHSLGPAYYQGPQAQRLKCFYHPEACKLNSHYSGSTSELQLGVYGLDADVSPYVAVCMAFSNI